MGQARVWENNQTHAGVKRIDSSIAHIELRKFYESFRPPMLINKRVYAESFY